MDFNKLVSVFMSGLTGFFGSEILSRETGFEVGLEAGFEVDDCEVLEAGFEADDCEVLEAARFSKLLSGTSLERII